MEGTGGKAIVVGGSIAGLSCAHALVSARWDVAVIEKSTAPSTTPSRTCSRSPTGAGLGLDPQSQEILGRWISHSQLRQATFPLSLDLNIMTDSGCKRSKTVTRDGNFNFLAAHWADLHSLLYEALPPGLILWGHQFISFQTHKDKSTVRVTCRVAKTGEIVEIEGDLLVAADGCLSAIRQNFLPNLKLRYSGYCAWRGVLDFSGKENSDLIVGMREAYPELGNCLYFDLACNTHAVLYELKDKRLNWIWYVNQPEPKTEGTSVTMKVSKDALHSMHEEADKVWVSQLASLMQETTDPFINIIYDSDPLPRLQWEGKIVLIGDAAHPTTPHGLRSTNMSVVDAYVLGKCLERNGLEGLEKALEEYQTIRLPVVSEQVLHARKLGRAKQGLNLLGEMQLEQRGMPYFDGAPTYL
ncbi:6-hydroxynicotinate 3-monooxygenase [Rhynchospora pubera]|uniref:6-hydroxynicotinate 3-monooxygenase n=1 Tax=Rhynchospora pubera TaxID=906938 RepID=A0AAV8AUG8_9POAL|nr:6-hydroxynicotinate 3-monooxygenase [Rhynchospora pubera]KAJ4789220.1 6-hydroxynicotinate 3-monooxygenase [Rhynchospora pubera]